MDGAPARGFFPLPTPRPARTVSRVKPQKQDQPRPPDGPDTTDPWDVGCGMQAQTSSTPPPLVTLRYALPWQDKGFSLCEDIGWQRWRAGQYLLHCPVRKGQRGVGKGQVGAEGTTDRNGLAGQQVVGGGWWVQPKPGVGCAGLRTYAHPLPRSLRTVRIRPGEVHSCTPGRGP